MTKRAGTKEEKENISVYVSKSQTGKIDVLVSKGYYKNRSECIQKLIDTEYSKRINNYRAELEEALRRNEELISALKNLETDTNSSIEKWVEEYKKTRSGMVFSSKENYESKRKLWINKNMDKGLREAFPGLEICEIYRTLEEMSNEPPK